MATGQPQELESLVGRVTLDVTDFKSGADGVARKLDELAAKFTQFGSSVGSAFTNLGQAITAPLAAAVASVGTSLAAVESQVVSFVTKMSKLDQGAMAVLGRSLSRIGDFMNAVNVNYASPKRFDRIGTGVAGFVNRVVEDTKDIEKASIDRFRVSSYSMGRIGDFLKETRRIGTSDLSFLPTVSGAISQFVSDTGALDPAKSLAVANTLSKFRTNLAALSGINPAQISAAGNAVRGLLNNLSTVPISPNLQAAAQAISRIGAGMRGMAAMGGYIPPNINILGGGGAGAGGGGGPAAPLLNMSRGFNAIPPAATRASTSLGNFGQAVKAMFLTSDTAMKGLQRIQTSLLGIAVLGVAQFSRLDDAMARTLAHMREFDPNSPVREQLQTGVLALSSGTRTGASDLARGLDKLTSSGMNATMALENLAIAENFAVASGMPMQKATQRLVDLMNATGLAVENTEDHYNNMRRLSDMIVGIASKVGSSEEQLSEAFTGRFINSMKTANLDVADAMALLATYSRFGETTRGAAAGTRLSRGLENLNIQATSHGPLWTALLGEDIMAGNGRFAVKGIELIERLGKALDGMDQQRRTAQLLKLGFNTEGIAALEPLLRQWPTIRLIRDELDKTGGISEKTAALIRSSLLGQLTTLFNAASNVATIFGERLAPVFHVVTTAISNMAIAFSRLQPWYQNLIIGATALFIVVRNLNVVFGLFAFVVSPVTMVLNGVIGGVSLLYKGFMLLLDLPSMLGSGLMSLFGMIRQGLTLAFSPLTMAYSLLSTVWGAMVRIGTYMEKLGQVGFGLGAALLNILTNFVAGITGIMTTLLSVVAILVLMGPLLAVLGTLAATAFTAVAAFAATAVLTLGSLASLIGSGLVAAWGAFQVAATAAMGWIGAAVTHVHDNVGALWESVKGGAAGFLKSAAAALEKIAGFFWNFQHNMKIIWGWFAEHGEQAFLDLANAGFKFIEILAGNLKLLFGAIGSTVYQTLTAAWGSIQAYLAAFFGWFGSQWKNIASDIGTIFNAMFDSFKANFGAIFPVISSLVDIVVEKLQLAWANLTVGYTTAQYARYAEYRITEWHDMWNDIVPRAGGAQNGRDYMLDFLKRMGYATDREGLSDLFATFRQKAVNRQLKIDHPEKMEAADSAYFADKYTKLAAGLPGMKLSGVDLAKLPYKTDMGGLGKALSGAGVDSIKMWEGLGGNVSDAFGKAFGGMTPFASAFKGIFDSEMWQELFNNLNLSLPEGGLKTVLAKFTPTFFGAPASEGEFGLAPPNKGGPGFKFTQTSLERTMIGGPVAENLEYQQLNTLKSIDRKQDNIVNAINNLGGAQPNRRPPPMMRDE